MYSEVRKFPQSVTFLAHSPVFVSRFKIRDRFQEKCWRRCASKFHKSAEGRPFRAHDWRESGSDRDAVPLRHAGIMFCFCSATSFCFLSCSALLCYVPFHSILCSFCCILSRGSPFSSLPFCSVLFAFHSV